MSEYSKTTDQALLVLLELVDNGPLMPAELARRLNLNRTVVHRLLMTLHRRAFVSRDVRGYAPGAVLIRIADRVRPELRAAAAKVMLDLATTTGETVVMHIADGYDAIVLDQCPARRHVVRVEHEIGSRHPLQVGASGRALLSHLAPSAVDRVLTRCEDAAELRVELERAAREGYVVSQDELQEGVHGLAVPVLSGDNRALASLAIIVPTSRAAALMSFLPVLKEAAARLGNAPLGAA